MWWNNVVYLTYVLISAVEGILAFPFGLSSSAVKKETTITHQIHHKKGQQGNTLFLFPINNKPVAADGPVVEHLVALGCQQD
jgi:hypothetical protein